MSTKPSVSDDELLALLEHEHPLTSREVAVLTGLGSGLHAHNRLMLLYGLSGGVETHPGADPASRLWWPQGALDES